MPMYFVVGQPGMGKSLFALRMIVQELRTSKRKICTNLPIVMGRLCEYLHEKYGSAYEAATRIRILNDDEVSDFYKHRGIGIEVEERVPIRINGKAVQHLNHSEVAKEHGGVLYVLDEAHIFFNARAWASIAEDAIFYNSQHRKLGDDIYICTQRIKNVDVQFRDLTQEYIQMVNRAAQKWGFWRAPGGFRANIWPKVPSHAPGEAPMEVVKFNLDVAGLASCYDTSAGVGIAGKINADTKKPRRGLPFWTMPVGAVLVIGLVVCALLWVKGKVSKGLTGYVQGTGAIASNAFAAPVTQPTVYQHPKGPAEETNTVQVQQLRGVTPKAEVKPLKVSAILRAGPYDTVYISDGRKYRSEDVIIFKGMALIVPTKEIIKGE